MNPQNKPETIDDYIQQFPPALQAVLQELRVTIHTAAPDATEKISYGMPTFYLAGNLVHFAAMKQHIGFYPAPSGIEAFNDELTAYGTSKGAIRFPLDEALPLALIARIVTFRAGENRARAKV